MLKKITALAKSTLANSRYLLSNPSPDSSQSIPSQEIKKQVNDYSLITNEWKPYIMRASSKHVKLAHVSTDENGSRVSYFKGSPVSYKDYRSSKGSHSVLLGNSVAYGVGASSDFNCIASELSRLMNHPWYNLAGRAYNQTQEVLSLLLLGAEAHKNIVVFSGINNLVFSLAFNQFSDSVMPFWGQDKLDELNGSEDVHSEAVYPMEIKYEKMIFFLDRDLRILSSFIGNPFGNDIVYVVQPLLAWLEKQLHPLEKDAINLWDEEKKGIFNIVHKPSNILPWKKRYLEDLEKLCRKHKINFFDMNSTDEFKQPEHLFLDRVHLTDLGQLRAAECIRNFLKSLESSSA
jgi:hypothetical protein